MHYVAKGGYDKISGMEGNPSKSLLFEAKNRDLLLPIIGVGVILFVVISMATLSWPVVFLSLFAGLLLILLAYRATYVTFYLGILLSLFLGLTISIPTGSLQIGERAFGGSIDIFLGEAVIYAVLIAWGLKVIFLWFKRGDVSWKPSWPAMWPLLALFGAHVISVFSEYASADPILTIKYALRPVLFCIIAFVVLPANLIRSTRRLKAILATMAVGGTLAALNAYLSLLPSEPFSFSVKRAHPIPMFGVDVLGGNHNLLAELLIICAPMTLALSRYTRNSRTRLLLELATAAQVLAALLTLSRTAWIVVVLQVVFLGATLWRESIKKHLSTIIMLGILMAPLALYQLNFSFSYTAQTSNTTRMMLNDIAWQAFLEHPIIGGGAGTFLWRVGGARIFWDEFGSPLDSHGFIPKLMTETGVLGVAAFLWLIAVLSFAAWEGMKLKGREGFVAFMLVTSAGSAIFYQMTSSTYWTSHMWVPIGIMLAGLALLKRGKIEKEVF